MNRTPPPPPIERPDMPVPPDEEDIADDVDIEPLDFDFPTFDDWEVGPANLLYLIKW